MKLNGDQCPIYHTFSNFVLYTQLENKSNLDYNLIDLSHLHIKSIVRLKA